MIHKRPFIKNDSYEVACKCQKRLEHTDQLASLNPFYNDHWNPPTTDATGNGHSPIHQDVGRLASDSITGVPNGGFKEYFDHGRWIGALLRPDEISALDYPFQKPVPIGSEHQAYVPDWNSHSSNQREDAVPQLSLAKSNNEVPNFDDAYEEKRIGTCVLPMPGPEASGNNCCQSTEVHCDCPDGGSISCVNKHICEAREKLRESLGEKLFEDLGFLDMGEEIAKNWTEEEEQAFHEVFLHPTLMGNNLWDTLSARFPSQTKKYIVSYYFNVFMLRKRAKQNRFEPLNIDSDNDEWFRSDARTEAEGLAAVLDGPAILLETADDSDGDVEVDNFSASEDAADVVHGVAIDEGNNAKICDTLGAYVKNFDVYVTDHKFSNVIPKTGGDDCNVRETSGSNCSLHNDSSGRDCNLCSEKQDANDQQ